ncbi:MAG: hypothetical protein AAGB51_12705 [Planctomycetota bacterium]
MALLYAGIDEAGYGPMLGPLCVGLSVFRVEGWTEGEPSPDLWQTLSGGVCRTLTEARGTKLIPIADSKKLKLSNQVKTKHPLVHLERGVLAFNGARSGDLPASDDGLFERLGAAPAAEAWYGEPASLPVGTTEGELRLDVASLRKTLATAGVELVHLGVRWVGESDFNRIVRETGTKAEATLGAVGAHLRDVVDEIEQDTLRVVCDRLGGRTKCGPLVARELPGIPVSLVRENPELGEYALGDGGQLGRIAFMPEAEEKHLPVALASMAAKLVRELAMARFNRYWSARVPELKPTAGYVQDAKRWLGEVGESITADERRRLVRLA